MSNATTLKSVLDYRKRFVCVLVESEISRNSGGVTLVREWRPVHAAEMAEIRTLIGRPVTEVSSDEGIYVDEDGNVFQLAEKRKEQTHGTRTGD